MYEVELKVPADHDAAREQLEDAGAKPLESVRQVDTYYDAPDRNFAETEEALRVRRETTEGGLSSVYLTYKGPLVDEGSKTRVEAETTVDDDDEMDAILGGLGYEAAARVVKERDRFELGGWLVALDTVDGLGEFVEVERETDHALEDDDDAMESARREATEVLSTLGLDADDQVRTSYLGLLLDSGEDVNGGDL